MLIDLKCNKCNVGFMRHTVLKIISIPIMYPHKCNKCGFEWNALPSSLLSGDGCRKCGTKKAHEKLIKKDEDVIKEISLKNPNVEIIGKYTGRHNSIKARCKICGYTWEPIVSSLLRGSSHKNAKVMHKNIE